MALLEPKEGRSIVKPMGSSGVPISQGLHNVHYITGDYDVRDGYNYHDPYAEEQCVFVICPTNH